jgi:hypothetical protein
MKRSALNKKVRVVGGDFFANFDITSGEYADRGVEIHAEDKCFARVSSGAVSTRSR